MSPPNCAECLAPSAELLHDLGGSAVCAECAAQYFIPCAGCAGLVPRDEAYECAGEPYCAACHARPPAGEAAEPISDGEAEALVTEYVALHREVKRLTDRLDELKERLKLAAAARPRAGSAVTLRAGDEAVRCAYTVKIKCDTEKVAGLEPLLGEEFGRLFERKVSYSPVKEAFNEFLASAGEDHAAARAAVRAAVEFDEVATLTVTGRGRRR
jgi:hypothetical protein